MENKVRKLTQAACRNDPLRMLMNAKTPKIDHHDHHVAAAGETGKIAISSRLKAELKDKGILAFKQLTDDEQKRVWQWCNEVVRLYRGVLETDRRNIRNVESLPFPKEDIKLALKISLPLYISKGMHSMVRKLKNLYQETGTFQNMDPKDHAILSAATTGKKKEISKKQYSDVDRVNDKYMERAISEKKVLLQDINNFVQELEALTSEGSS